MVVVLAGHVTIEGSQEASEAEMVLLEREGRDVLVQAEAASRVLVLTGEPIDEPVVGHGPFVMNPREEIVQAFHDFQNGRFGRMTEGTESV